METPRRILLIRPSALGDVCRTVPVLASLRARFRDAEISWLVQDSFAPAVEAHPGLTRIVPFPRRTVAISRLWRPSAGAVLLEFLHSLRDAGYDLVIDCQGLGRSGFFAFVTGAERRVGYAQAREFGWLGVNERVTVPVELHAVDRMLALIEGCGVPAVRDMRLYTRAEDREAAGASVGSERFAVLAPTSRWAGKRWPIERFVELARALLDRSATERIAVVGGPGERDQCGPLLDLAARDRRVIDLVGKTSLGVLMAVIERASLVVANDSAPVHMAVGFDRPLVAIFGPTRPELVGPYGRERDVIHAAVSTRNEHKNEGFGIAAMKAIPASAVIDAALRRLESWN
ncbi:MAG: glycosyltransferase family 9 protein [Phycisphaerae bacterium]|nr:glycosyltransferase family 9 protein [Phycisphaerae bacterium]